MPPTSLFQDWLGSQTFRDNARLWITLFVAAVQGVVLFRLHVAIDAEWPGTDSRWLVTFYTLALLVPVTLHLLAAHVRQRVFWIALAAMAGVSVGLAWHFGSSVSGPPGNEHWASEDYTFGFVVTMLLMWLLTVAFLRSRLDNGRWRSSYAHLFSAAWQNKLTIAEALAFTGAFWLLLLLWAVLFKSLGYDLFERLFQDPAFVYPFTAITFGVAMHLVGSTERLVSVAREQVLGLLKWLAPVAALILLLFTPTLLVKLPGLVFEGERAVQAAWLICLVLASVTLLNAGYQDGQAEQPYPRWLGLALRVAIPTMPLVAAVAIYALLVRMNAYGTTVARVHGLAAAVAALVYAIGYAIVAFRRGPWLRGIEGVNVATALGLLGLLFLLSTPLLSPYRLAANSQAARAMVVGPEQESAMKYLKFDAGEYGRRRLAALKNLSAGESGQAIARLARSVDTMTHPYEERPPEPGDSMAETTVFPPGRVVEPDLMRALRGHGTWHGAGGAILFVDLDEDGTEEVVLLLRYSTLVFGKAASGWKRITHGKHPAEGLMREVFEDAKAGRVAVSKPRFNTLRIGNRLIDIYDGGCGVEDGGDPATRDLTAHRRNGAGCSQGD